MFDENVAEEMTRATLFSERITSVGSMERLGLLTLGKQEKLRGLVEQLTG